MNPTGHKYTIESNPALERELDAFLGDLAEEVARNNFSDSLKYLVLGGSYGRGDGGVLRRENAPPALYNDLDFFVIASDQAPGNEIKRLNAFFKNAAPKYSKRMNVDVDFSNATRAAGIARNLNIMMWREMAEGGYVVFGDGNAFKKEFRAAANTPLPPSEAARLLFNRGYGLFLAREKVSEILTNADDINFVARNINKAILACGDVLILSQVDCPLKAIDRLETLQKLDLPNCAFKASLVASYKDAVNFKAAPRASFEPGALLNAWNETAALMRNTIAYVSPLLSDEKTTAVQKLKNAVKNFKLEKQFKNLSLFVPIFSNPLLYAIHVPEKLLDVKRTPAPAEKESFTTIWKLIN